MTRPTKIFLVASLIALATACSSDTATQSNQNASDLRTRTCDTSNVNAPVPEPGAHLGTETVVFIGTAGDLHDELNWSEAGYAIEKIPINLKPGSSSSLVTITTADPDLARLAYERTPDLGSDQFEEFPSQTDLERCEFQASYAGAIILREPHCVQVIVTEDETSSSVNIPLGGSSCG